MPHCVCLWERPLNKSWFVTDFKIFHFDHEIVEFFPDAGEQQQHERNPKQPVEHAEEAATGRRGREVPVTCTKRKNDARHTSGPVAVSHFAALINLCALIRLVICSVDLQLSSAEPNGGALKCKKIF